MDTKMPDFQKATPIESHEDLLTLSRVLSLSKLNYIDFTLQKDLQETMERWPLLAELAQANQTGLK